MIIRNKLDKAFGPIVTPAGIFLFVAGLIITCFSLTGLILLIIGAFLGFTSTSTFIDFDNRRLRFSYNIFGIFSIGQWLVIQADMKIGIQQSNKVWRAYSRGNRRLDIVNNDFRLMLYDSKDRAILAIQKSDNMEAAKSDLEKLSK